MFYNNYLKRTKTYKKGNNMINNLQQFYENSVITACGTYITASESIMSANQRATTYVGDAFTSLQQQGNNIINNLQQFYENSVITACGTYITASESIISANQRVTTYVEDAFTSLQQQSTNAKEGIKNIFTQVYEHPLTPYASAGLFAMATGSLIGLPLTTSLVIGVSAKLIGEGLDYGLENISNVSTRAFSYLGYANTETPATWKQTATILPIALGSFALGLHAESLALAAKLSSILAIAIIGSFALGSTLRA